MTVRNDADGCAVTLDSLAKQIRRPDEIVVVDGGSTDRTLETLHRFHSILPELRIMVAQGANIATGRNVGTAEAAGEIIASIDGGCRAAPEWLAELLQPFETDPSVEFVAGTYRIEPHSLLESAVGLATMRGQLEPFDPQTFNPSARSMAFTKELWVRAGRWPEWLGFSEDTLFDHRVRRLNATWRLADKAVVHWRPRGSLRGIARQFYHYGTGRGHTRIDASAFAYQLRNMAILTLAIVGSLFYPTASFLAVASFLYFFVWAFHRKARRVAAATGRITAYPLCMAVMWVVLASNTLGYVVGSWQRIRSGGRYERLLREYMSPGAVRSECAA